MTLASGTKLAHYEIVEPIGKGGMGEVYRALDGKLGREVAIKVLPDEFSRDAERLARFKREAKVLASLNHPNIAAIHGLEESDDTHYLVLELVPGETLADRIARRPIPVDESIVIATQIAEGLEEAHEQGIVHRDLKPANIKLTPDDKVKILDFGLAKAFVEEGTVADDSMSPTITRDATRIGVVLGTAAYMSPEQAKGKRVDRRTDIFAFGSVLYEMLTGKRAFRGENVSETLAAVMKDEPDWSALPGELPARVQRALRRCLAKVPTKRTRHIGDVELELEESELELSNGKPGDERREALLTATSLVAIVAVGVALWALLGGEAADPKPVSWWRISLPPGASLNAFTPTVGNSAPALAVSPDGRDVAYVLTGVVDSRQVYLKTADSLDASPVEGAEGGSVPFFSADGRSLGFLSGSGQLTRVSLDGGAPIAIAEAGLYVRGAVWGIDGSITFSLASDGGMYRVLAAGGGSEILGLPDRNAGEKALGFPELLPTGDAVVLTLARRDIDTYDDAAIAAFFPKTGDVRVLIQGGYNARYSPSGHLVYARGGALYAAPLDLERVEIVGDPVRVLEGVASYPTNGWAEFSIARDGSLFYAPGPMLGDEYHVVLVDREGRATSMVDERRAFYAPRFSPDGQSLGLTSNDANMSVWRYDLTQGTLTRLVFGGNNGGSAWTPDGTYVAFWSDRDGPQDVFSVSADASEPERKLVGGEVNQQPLSWAPDGRMLVFRQFNSSTGYDLWLLADDGNVSPILATKANEVEAAVAPSGRWMAYESDESGRPEIYVCEFPGGESKRRVSADGGNEPRWNPNGRELFYRNGGRMMVVDVQAGDTLALGRPRELFESNAFAPGGGGSYDVGADGQTFAMIDTSRVAQPPTELVLVQNWAEELKRLVPTN